MLGNLKGCLTPKGDETSELVGKVKEIPSFESGQYATTPYDLAKQEWDNRMGALVVRAKNWRILCFFLVAVLILLSLIGLNLSSKPSIIPFYIEINQETGQVKKVERADHIQYEPSVESIKYFLYQWIKRTRGLSPDIVLLESQVRDAYGMLSSQGANKLSYYIKETKPLDRVMNGESMSVDFVSFHSLTKTTHQLTWEETLFVNGKFKNKVMMSAVFTIALSTPKDEEALLVNPLGIYIDDFSWDRVRETGHETWKKQQ